jgi:hypothetical protein
MQDVGDVHYVNTGDWVESCTAVAENEDGSFELIKWTRLSAYGEEELRAVKAVAENVADDPAQVLAFDPQGTNSRKSDDQSEAA